jgi:transposase
MYTIGLDVHQSRTSVCVLDGKGNTLRQEEVKGDYQAVAAYLAKIRRPFQVCYEASTGYGVLYDLLTPLAEKIEVAHAGRLALIYKSKKKHNRADAQKLASVMHLNQVPVVHVPNQEVRSWRGLIEHRRSLVDQSTAVKNQIRALLRGQGIKGLPGRRQWTQAGIKWLGEQKWPTAHETLRLEILLEQLEDVRKKAQRITKALDQIAGEHPGVQLLMTIPGVGVRTAEAFVAYVDDPARFHSGAIGAYFGLVPREDSTGDYRHLGHITREGPPTVRKLVTEAAWRGAFKSARIKAVYERILKGDPGRKKLAIVATGHWLCRVMLAMLKTGEAFRELEAPVPAPAPAVEGQVPEATSPTTRVETAPAPPPAPAKAPRATAKKKAPRAKAPVV